MVRQVELRVRLRKEGEKQRSGRESAELVIDARGERVSLSDFSMLDERFHMREFYP